MYLEVVLRQEHHVVVACAARVEPRSHRPHEVAEGGQLDERRRSAQAAQPLFQEREVLALIRLPLGSPLRRPLQRGPAARVRVMWLP